MKKNIRLMPFILLLLSMTGLGGCGSFGYGGPKAMIDTGKGRHSFGIEIADTPDLRKRGLMFRTSMPEDRGMLFFFDKEEPQAFWMKNTLIPLDMLFISADYKVVSVAKNAVPCKTKVCDVYPSVKPAQYVLEVNGGISDKYGIKEGDTVEWVK